MKKNKKLKICVVLIVGALLSSSFSVNAFGETERNPNVNSIKTEYTVKIGQDKYYVKFKACIGNKHATTPTFAIITDIDSKIQKYQKIQQSNSCRSYDVDIHAKYADNVTIRMLKLSNFV